MKKIAIIGGGISGLYFANLLNNEKDFEYKIFEKKVNYNFEKESVYINPIDYYFSNSISRASKVMSECRDIKLKYQKSGTNN